MRVLTLKEFDLVGPTMDASGVIQFKGLGQLERFN